MSLSDLLFQAKPPVGAPPFAPAPMQSGGSNAPTTPDTLPVKQGLSGFLDRFLKPQNALGQFGRALVMAGGTPLGDAYQLMDRAQEQDFDNLFKRQQLEEMQRKANLPKIEQVGSALGIVDPATGQFRETYRAPEAPTSFARDLTAAGIDPNSDEGRQLYRQKVENTANPMMGVQGFDAEGRPTITFMPRGAGAGATPQPGALAPPARPAPAPATSGGYDGPDPTTIPNMTSGRRTEYGNRLVGGVDGSNHLTGDAADYGLLPGETVAQAAERIRKIVGPTARVLPEPKKNHVHVDFPKYGKVPPFGKRGTQRGPSARAASPPSGFVLD